MNQIDLIINALHSNIEILNLSNSDDTKVLLNFIKFKLSTDIHHAGTAMILTAFLAQIEDENL